MNKPKYFICVKNILITKYSFLTSSSYFVKRGITFEFLNDDYYKQSNNKDMIIIPYSSIVENKNYFKPINIRIKN